MNNLKQKAAKERLSTVKQLKDTSSAIAKIKQILDDCPELIPGWLELGLCYRQSCDRALALETFEKALKFHPQDARIRIQLSIEQLHFGKLEDCQENLEQLLAIAPDRVRGIINLGKVYQRQGKGEQAIELYKKALQINPQAHEATINLVEQLQKCNLHDEAIKYLQKAVDRSPKHFGLLICWGKLEQSQRNFSLALEHFQKAIALHPDRIDAYFCQIDTLWKQGNYDEATKQLENLHSGYGDRYPVLIYSGDFERKLGQREKSLRWHQLAQTKAAGSGQVIKAQVLIAEDLKALGRYDEALQKIESAIALKPKRLPSLVIKGSILLAQAELSKAAEVYEYILSLKPVHFEARIELANIYSQSGQVERAIALLEETQSLLGNKVETCIRLGWLYQALEDWDNAETYYVKACLEQPENYRGYYELANLHFLQGNIETAFELLDLARQKGPYSLEVGLRRIQFQKSLGNVDLCKQLALELTELFPHSTQLRWLLCNIYISRGDFTDAHDVLAQIDVDNQYANRTIQQLKGEVYINQYSYQKAEECLRTAISLAPIASAERNRLATILMITGRIDEARQELKIATQELCLKVHPGKVVVPLKSHIAMIINQLRINPPLLTELLQAQATAANKILAFGRILKREPNYLGAALYLARELRIQGILDRVKYNLPQKSADVATIPKRIIQFWDEPEPPAEVEKICQSWQDCNPEYEYQRFSLDEAIAFLREHYDERVLRAFANCDLPATQSDFFRLAYLYKMGGFYADADDKCRQSLDPLVDSNPELVILQEDFACIGNNFLGCIPGQSIIQQALEQAIENLSYYSNESPWFKSGPGLLTSAVAYGLTPYLSNQDYQTWPRLLVLNQTELRNIVVQHIYLPYKRTDKSWLHESSNRRLKTLPVSPQAVRNEKINSHLLVNSK